MMDRTSPIYAALVSQTEATIADQQRSIELFTSGAMRIGAPGSDNTAAWVEQLQKWLPDNERLLAMLKDGTI